MDKVIKLKDGTQVRFIRLFSDRAEDVIQMMIQMYTDTDYLARYPDEVTVTIEQERQFLDNLNSGNKGIMMGVEIDGKLCGSGSINPISKNDKLKHRCALAISLYKTCWGKGIGSALMQELIECAEVMGYEQIELEVVEENQTAIHLYEKYGFVVTGRYPNAFKLRNGIYHDLLLMIKQID